MKHTGKALTKSQMPVSLESLFHYCVCFVYLNLKQNTVPQL